MVQQAILRPLNVDSFIPDVMNCTRFDISAAKMLTLATTPMDLLPPLTGYVYAVLGATYIKSNGPVFTGGAGKTLNVQMKNAAFTNITGLGLNFCDLALGAAYQLAATAFQADDAAASSGSKGIRLIIPGGVDMGGTGSTVSVILYYYIMPTYFENIGSI